ncbi:MAG: hypothetical protein DI613_12415 [Kocuria rhizophila]|uniref:hypothetical protein n=1 Tax=Kocuria carniphila TaxID=262208 RepID=UPI000DB1D4AB|nr:hypothetical protein [Kocuria carniphila]MCT1803457.1 hypothetical protein [Kocuria carniphila]PZP28992.1 MAG: hypothetical protein DI613_12415 [Kocuria rhizophila]
MLVVVTAVVALAVLHFCTWRICRKAGNARGSVRDHSKTDGLKYEKPVIWSLILSLVLLAPMVIPLGIYTAARGGQLPAEFQFFTNDFTLQALAVISAIVAETLSSALVFWFGLWRTTNSAQTRVASMKAPRGSTYIKPVALGLVAVFVASTVVLQIVLWTLAPAAVVSNRAILVSAAIAGVLGIAIPVFSYIAARSVLNHFVPVADRDTAEVGEFYKANSVNAMLALSLAVSGAALVVTSSLLIAPAYELSESFGAGSFVALTFILGFVIVAVYVDRLSESSRLAYLKSIRTEAVPQS